jgi:mono/diheme cytochrome c family protein
MRLHKSSWLCLIFLLGIIGLAACGDNTATTAPPAAAPTTAAVAAAPTTAAAAPTTAAGAAGATTAAAGGTTAAAAAAAPTPPLPTQSDTRAEAGRLVFARSCAGCHLGQGTQAGRAPQLSVSQNAINADLVRTQVRNGKNRMPAFDQTKVTDAELEGIIVYLKAIHTS